MFSIIRQLYTSKIISVKFLVSSLFCLLVFIYDRTRLQAFAKYIDAPLTLGEPFIFTLSNIFSVTVYSLAIIFTLSDTNTQPPPLALNRHRTSKLKSKIRTLVTLLKVVFTMLILLLLCDFISLSPMDISDNWSEPLNVMSFVNPSLSEDMFGIYYCAPNVISSFNVPEAASLAFVLMFLYINILVLILYACDSFFKSNVSVFITMLFHFVDYGLSYSKVTSRYSLLARSLLNENNLMTQYDEPRIFSLTSSLILLAAVYVILVLVTCINKSRDKSTA